MISCYQNWFLEWTVELRSGFKGLRTGSNFRIDPGFFALQGTHCLSHSVCALPSRIWIAPCAWVLAVTFSCFQTPFPLQPRLGFNHELFFIFLPLSPTHCSCRGILLYVITLRNTTLGRTSLDEGSARCRDFYLTTHNTHKRQTDRRSFRPVEFEPAILASKRPKTYTLDLAANHYLFLMYKYFTNGAN
jgi:hypothetical protein